jgi:DHA2 family methylenomycin A resistance protein-like MFS transporter
MRKWLIMLATGLMLVLVNLDMTVVYLSVATITSVFHTTMIKAQWVINSYLMATIAFFTLCGRLADNYGRKRIFLAGIFVFTAASLWCGLSGSINELIVARFAQGIGFAATLGLALVICAAAFPPKQRGFAAGIAVTISGVAQAVGPTVGGAILQYVDWNWIFLINVPLGILSFIATCAFVEKDDPNKARLPIRTRNVLLFMSSTIFLSYSLNELPNLSVLGFIALFGFGVLLMTWFVRRSFRAENPLIDVKLLTHKAYQMILMIRFLTMYFMGAMLFVLPMYMQNVLNIPPLKAGLILFFMGVLVAVVSPFVGKVLDECGFRLPLIWASLFGFVSSLVLAMMPPYYHAYTFLLVVMLLYGMCIGIHLPASVNGALRQTPEESHGTAIGLFFTVAIGGTLVGVAISGAILTFVSSSSLLHFLSGIGISLQGEEWAALKQVANASRNLDWFLANHTIAKNELTYLASHASFYSALHQLAFVCSVLMLCATFLSLKLERCSKKLR